MIIKYIRDKKGRLKGCVVKDGDKYGYSLVHSLDRNKNSKKMARKIAIERAEKTILKTRTEIVHPTGYIYDNKYMTERISNGRCRLVPHTIVPYLKKLMEIECPENVLAKL